MGPRNVLVTGGSSGIGRATVRRFAEAGDRVWFTYLTGRDRAHSLIAELREDGRQDVRAFEFDQGDWQSHQRLLDSLPGPVEVLVNNSALGSKTVERYVPDGPPHVWDEALFRVNSLGPLWLFRELLPGMMTRGYGKVVNISSVGGGVAQFPGFKAADEMSKAALACLTRHAAAELAHAPVDVFAICPGAVGTAMFEASTLAGLAPEQRGDLVADLPKGRLIRPEEIADLVCWLCGDQARVLHGAVIDASMGLGVRPGLLTESVESTESTESAESAESGAEHGRSAARPDRRRAGAR